MKNQSSNVKSVRRSSLVQSDKKFLWTYEICEKSFTRKSHLDHHKAVHEKEHDVCTHCNILRKVVHQVKQIQLVGATEEEI